MRMVNPSDPDFIASRNFGRSYIEMEPSDRKEVEDAFACFDLNEWHDPELIERRLRRNVFLLGLVIGAAGTLLITFLISTLS